ncbi:hypothetical protein H0A36_23300 [Endozoicomonas sp. SM1973]|uniref:Uncharacterized protein n=1 Tax=Spartinivicinus marinus TaxID=2994442 RepID=A0A853IG38_9GAMM|nr:hypothetical protein [Spartinivicinus marinus]MCX4027768.1 hypothetical protein [Spartinivicinus marinus]NYZ68951.1 hypothetical protein [Spartinivicinus marinus]
MTFAMGKNQVWDFGTLLFSLKRQPHEWQVHYKHFNINPEAERNEVLTWCGECSLTDDDNFKRFVFSRTHKDLTITPTLPDRNLVAKPIVSITLMPEEQITLYVSVALWLRVSVKSPTIESINNNKDDYKTLCELPIRELSNTWFGPNTLEGELCYASKTHALVNQESLTLKPYRAIVPVSVINNQPEILKVEKINIPVPALGLYRNSSGLFWASGVTLVKLKNSNQIKLSTTNNTSITPADKSDNGAASGIYTIADELTNTSNTSASQLQQWENVSVPRRPIEEKFITRAYDVFFS